MGGEGERAKYKEKSCKGKLSLEKEFTHSE